jgi:iron(III) transport system ATP-binding protein
LTVAGVTDPERAKRVHAALALVELDGFADRRPALLSGGQRQRVALARCLVTEPALVLLDEPLANLDVHLRAAMEREFARFHERTGTTMIYITHDQTEAMALADRIAVMDKGRVLQFATPSQLYREPADATVAVHHRHRCRRESLPSMATRRATPTSSATGCSCVVAQTALAHPPACALRALDVPAGTPSCGPYVDDLSGAFRVDTSRCATGWAAPDGSRGIAVVPGADIELAVGDGWASAPSA